MAELKTKPNDASVSAFLDTVDEKRRADCYAVLEMMKKATGSEPQMWGPSIVGFGRYRYQGASGSREWFLAGFSPRKNDLTLYLVAGAKQYPALLKNLGKHKTTGSCLYLKRLTDVDLDVLNELITRSVQDLAKRKTAQ